MIGLAKMRERRTNLVGREHDRLADPALRAHDTLDPVDLLLENGLVQEEGRAERLVLGRGSEVSPHREIGEERLHLLLSHFGRVPAVVKADEATDPVDVRLLRPVTVVASGSHREPAREGEDRP
jgi:hypothetical protein